MDQQPNTPQTQNQTPPPAPEQAPAAQGAPAGQVSKATPGVSQPPAPGTASKTDTKPIRAPFRSARAISTKRLAISKSNAQMVAVVAVASFVTVFCLVAAKTVLSQNNYQNHVISAKEKAHKQLVANLAAYDDLSTSYKIFNAKNPNVLGGSITGSGDNDGTNSKLVLDALPPTYNFPALTASLEKILSDRGLKVSSITGTDDEVAQQGNTSSPTPQPVTMPFTFTVSDTSYAAIADLTKALEHSIRPIQVDTLNLTGGSNDMTATFTAHTYYEPAKSLQITKKVIK